MLNYNVGGDGIKAGRDLEVGATYRIGAGAYRFRGLENRFMGGRNRFGRACNRYWVAGFGYGIGRKPVRGRWFPVRAGLESDIPPLIKGDMCRPVTCTENAG